MDKINKHHNIDSMDEANLYTTTRVFYGKFVALNNKGRWCNSDQAEHIFAPSQIWKLITSTYNRYILQNKNGHHIAVDANT